MTDLTGIDVDRITSLNEDDDDGKIMYKREWLNEKEGTAYLVLNAQTYSKGSSVDVEIEIKDCNRQITLDFWFGDEKERAEKLEKMDRLLALLQEARIIIAGHELVEKEKKTKVE